MEPWMVYRPEAVFANFHHFDDEQDPDPDPHRSEKRYPDPDLQHCFLHTVSCIGCVWITPVIPGQLQLCTFSM
jgi:hypothetical protein